MLLPDHAPVGATLSRPYHAPLTVAGRTYGFAHLEPFQMLVSSQKASQILRIRVRFSNHCFSEKFDQATHPTGTAMFPDAGGRPRVFSPIRYDLSHYLPQALSSLEHPKARVQQTAQRRNWLHAMAIDSPIGPYLIFFELRRSPLDDRHLQDLNLTVESAYPKGSSRLPDVIGKIGFVLLAGKIYKGKPAATRR